jgi:hypothetical protein
MRRSALRALALCGQRRAQGSTQPAMQQLSHQHQHLWLLPAAIAPSSAGRQVSTVAPAVEAGGEALHCRVDLSILEALEEAQAQLTPRAVVERLDRYIIGQAEAKKAVAVAFRNRWRRWGRGPWAARHAPPPLPPPPPAGMASPCLVASNEAGRRTGHSLAWAPRPPAPRSLRPEALRQGCSAPEPPPALADDLQVPTGCRSAAARRRHRVPEQLRSEIHPKNILMIGPTGCGKTEIARRLAKLADAPFVKVRSEGGPGGPLLPPLLPGRCWRQLARRLPPLRPASLVWPPAAPAAACRAGSRALPTPHTCRPTRPHAAPHAPPHADAGGGHQVHRNRLPRP